MKSFFGSNLIIPSMKRENLKRLKFTALKAYIFSSVLGYVNILHAFIR